MKLLLSILLCSVSICFCINESKPSNLRVWTPKPQSGDSIKSVTVRDLKSPDGTAYFRVESSKATITPKDLKDGSPFPVYSQADKDYIVKYLQATPNDIAGPFVAATLGGTADRYNLAPEYKKANALAWDAESKKIIAFLKKNRNGIVDLTLSANYPDSTSGRPINFTYSTEYSNNGQRQEHLDVHGSVSNHEETK